ncbi:MAG TPA: ZIP family metal transporter [Candidatus Saccharimonadales bacterium]|nr:ZIP family metal transporter [Candidatus Saccharimonadales bacterium]
MTIFTMILAIIIGSGVSLLGGALLLRFKKRRQAAILLTMPFGAGALLAAAYFDLLPESFELAEPRSMLLYCLAGFIFFFVLERCAGWFHHHHEHEQQAEKNAQQRRLIMLGDMTHNAIDGVAIGAAFLVSIPTGIITTLAVSAHEIPKELGTFALLLSKGWKDKTVVLANLATAVATIAMASIVYWLGQDISTFVAPLLAMTSGFFIYVAASDIIPDIHEQPRRVGTIQAAMLVAGVVIVGWVITMLGV